jgi:hypothetical protein
MHTVFSQMVTKTIFINFIEQSIKILVSFEKGIANQCSFFIQMTGIYRNNAQQQQNQQVLFVPLCPILPVGWTE